MFPGGLQPEISANVKQTCIGWESGKLGEVVTHSLHTERLPEEEKRKKQRKADQQLSSAFVKIGEWGQQRRNQHSFFHKDNVYRRTGNKKNERRERGSSGKKIRERRFAGIVDRKDT